MIAGPITSDQVRLASDVADEFFPNISCDAYGEDVSWLATMRVLLPSRLPAGENARLKFIEDAGAGTFMEAVDMRSRNTVTVISLDVARDKLEQTAKTIIKAGIPGHEFHERIYHRFHDQERPEYYLLFIQDDIANSVVITDGMNCRKWHLLQTFVRTYFKNLFQTNPLTESEMALLQCYYKTDRNLDHYKALMAEFEKPYDIRSAIIKKALTGFASNIKRRRLAQAENRVETLAKQISDRQQAIRELTAQREKAMIEVYGLRFSSGKEEGDEELLQYFLANKSLVFTTCEGNEFHYWVKGQLTYWDDQIVGSYISTTSGYLYNGCEAYDINKRKFQRLLKEIFVERKVKVLMAAAFCFKSSDSSVGIDVEEDASRPPELKDYLPNPHLMGYSCWGTHAGNLADATARGDIAEAVAVTVAATTQITINDSAMAKFSAWLCAGEKKCLLLPDGSRMTCEEYLDTL